MKRQGTLHAAGLTGLLLIAGAGIAFGQSLPNVPRNKTLVVAHDTEAPVYRNVGLANPYSVTTKTIVARSLICSSRCSTSTR